MKLAVIYVVIPVFNRKNFTRECLLTLRAQTYTRFKTVVVDDGSTDGTDMMIAEEFPEVVILKSAGNLFWTASINIGIRYSLAEGATHIFTLNNDTLTYPDLLEKMNRWSQQMPKALLGSLDIDAKTKKPYYGGERLHWGWGTTRFLLDELTEGQRHGVHEVSLFPARGLLIPRVVFDTIGLFEEKQLPHYYADYDFTVMARRHGFPVYCNYDARLFTYPEEGGDHKIRKTKNLKNYFNHLFGIKGGGNLRNFTIFLMRNSPWPFIPYHLAKGYAQRIFGYFLH